MMGSKKLSKRYCKRFFTTVAALFAILLLYGFIFDPWQLFHQPWFRKPIFISNARFQNAGIINSYSFDSVILGNSMAENFSAAEASGQLDGTFVNLSMAGSLFSERSIVLEHLFRKKNVRQIIISLDHLPYVKEGQYSQDTPPEQFAFLYNGNPFDDFKLYFDLDLFRCWNFAEENSCWEEIPGAARKKSLEKLYPWYPYYVKAFGGAQAWCSWSKQSAPFKAFLQETVKVVRDIGKGKKNSWADKFIAECEQNTSSTFGAYILPFIKEEPETQFLLFFPPYSRLWYGMQEQYYTGYYRTYQLFIEQVVKATSAYPNVRIFGFDTMAFTADIANYKDQSHYHKDINSRLLELMAASSNVLTEDNLESYLIEITELAHSYDLKRVTGAFKECLNQ